MNRERELWAMALWVEKHHGEFGIDYILDHIEKLEHTGEDGGILLWSQVFDRFLLLRPVGVEFS